METDYEQKINKIREQFSLREREIEEIQQRYMPAMDSDILRLKLLSEIEEPHRKAIEMKNRQIEDLETNIFGLRRNLENIRADQDSLKTA